jgi:small GTP-binding protein
VDFKSKIITTEDNKRVKVLLWDTAGQERFRGIATNYFHGSDSVLLVFDISLKRTFDLLPFWIEQLKQKRNLDDLNLFLVGNKKDLEKMRQVESTDIQKFVEENGIKKYFEVSALENIGIDGMFEYIVKESVDLVIKRDWDNHSETLSGINKLNINKNLKTKSSNRDGCCS